MQASMPSMPLRRCARRAAQAGLSYLAMMFTMASLALAAAGTVQLGLAHERWQAEEELLFVGGEYRAALRRWREAAPDEGAAAQGPQRLEDLLLDPRHVTPRRHLRRLYADPITGRNDWVLMRDERGHILGLHSASNREAVRRDSFPSDFFFFKHRRLYSEWLFLWGVPCTDSGCELRPGRPR